MQSTETPGGRLTPSPVSGSPRAPLLCVLGTGTGRGKVGPVSLERSVGFSKSVGTQGERSPVFEQVVVSVSTSHAPGRRTPVFLQQFLPVPPESGWWLFARTAGRKENVLWEDTVNGNHGPTPARVTGTDARCERGALVSPTLPGWGADGSHRNHRGRNDRRSRESWRRHSRTDDESRTVRPVLQTSTPGHSRVLPRPFSCRKSVKRETFRVLL